MNAFDNTRRMLGVLPGASSAIVQRQWRLSLAGLAVAVVAILFLFRDAVLSLVQTWYDSNTYNHGFVIVPISAWLIWERRRELAELVPSPSLLAAVPMALCCIVWLLAQAVGVVLVQQLALVGAIQSAAIGLLGWRLAWAMAFPLFYLLFAVPAGDELVAPLQDMTAIATVRLLQLSGIPVYLDGLFIAIPTGNFHVAEACAGLRYLIASVALGALFANITYRSWTRRLAFMALSIIVPIGANALRAYGIVIIAYATDNRVAVGVDHLIYGWIFLSFVTLILLGIGMAMRDPADRAGVRPMIVPGFAPPQPATLPTLGATALLLAVLLGTGGYAAAIELRAPPVRSVTVAPPELRAPWALSPQRPAWKPSFAGADGGGTFAFTDGKRTVQLDIGFYARERQGAEAVSAIHALVPDPWVRLGGGRGDAALAGRPLSMEANRIAGNRSSRLVWHWYWIDGTFTGSPYVGKLLGARAQLLGGERAAAILAVSTAADEDGADAAGVRGFFQALPDLGAALRRSGG